MAAEIGSLYIGLTANAEAFARDMGKAEGSVDRFGRRTGGVLSMTQTRMAQLRVAAAATSASLASLSKIPGLFGLGLGTVGLANLGKSVRDVVNETDSLVKSARKIGIGFEALQELRYGFDLAGVSADQTTEALAQFARRISEATSKGGDLADVLEANGIAIRDANGNIRPILDLMRDYAELIRRAGSDAERLDLAQRAFGRSGTGMVLALRTGAGAIDDASKAAREAGVVLSEDLAAGVEEVNDAFTRLEAQASTGFKKVVLGLIADARSAGNELSTLDKTLKFITDKFGFLELAEERAKGTLRLKLKLGTQEPGFTLDDLRGKASVAEAPTAIPTSSGSGSIRTREQRDAVEELIRSLQTEKDLIGATDTQRAVSNALRQAGADATDEQRARISALVTAIGQEQGALEAARAAQEAFTGAAGDFFGSLLSDLENGAEPVDALTSALKRLESQLVQMALNAAIKNIAASLFGGISGGFGGMGVGLGTLSTLYHVGGKVGAGGAQRRVSSSVFASAPRFHGGLRTDEVPAILKRGEQVLTREMAAREGATIAGLSALASGGGGELQVKVDVTQVPGHTAEVQQGKDGSLEVIIRKVEGRMAASIAGNGVVGRAIAGTFDLKRKVS